ncbi:hypothetical protein J3459_018396 [Metarhizium acridum]|uniref:uncharacterized protein n=1 Tax=Metarhizium acridum TaxID=92637 RepID=UPI001C6C0823|nr:hypothetical protein J3459_018396 [Metarhizium acridum]KAG8412577.1 hypothetical protein J3458_014287 [Metarhizium acridum]
MIEEKLKIDPHKQPWFDSHAEQGRPCEYPFNVNCATVYYKVQSELTRFSKATAWVKIDKIPFTSVSTGTYEKTINVAKSQSLSRTLTRGWRIIGVNVAINQ